VSRKKTISTFNYQARWTRKTPKKTPTNGSSGESDSDLGVDANPQEPVPPPTQPDPPTGEA
jgi:hypothetical protein